MGFQIGDGQRYFMRSISSGIPVASADGKKVENIGFMAAMLQDERRHLIVDHSVAQIMALRWRNPMWSRVLYLFEEPVCDIAMIRRFNDDIVPEVLADGLHFVSPSETELEHLEYQDFAQSI